MSNTSSMILGGGTRSRRSPIRAVVAALLVPCLCPLTTSGADESLPKAEAILDKHLEAMGGRAAFEKLHNRVTKGTLAIAGLGAKAKMTTYGAAPQKQYTLIESDTLGKIESGTDGKTVWKITTMQGPAVTKGDERALELRQAMFHGILDWKKLYKSAQCIAVEEIDAAPCYKVVMTPKEGKPETYYYDKKTYILVKVELVVETAMGTMSVVVTPSDYKRVDGILISHKTIQIINGFQKIEFVIETVEHNTEIPAEKFKVPAAVQELLDKKAKESAG